jgi:hypothetical protein
MDDVLVPTKPPGATGCDDDDDATRRLRRKDERQLRNATARPEEGNTNANWKASEHRRSRFTMEGMGSSHVTCHIKFERSVRQTGRPPYPILSTKIS